MILFDLKKNKLFKLMLYDRAIKLQNTFKLQNKVR